MAEASISISQDEFNCSICLDILNDPVTIPCGHTFCMGCITGYWNNEDRRQPCKCPLCNRNYAHRPALGKNTILAGMLVKMKNKNKIPTTNSPVRPGDVACDFCLNQKQKAVLQCLKCQACFCKDHAVLHQKSAAFQFHPLIKISKGLWKTCTRSGHGLPRDIFCIDDQKCLCLRCLEWGHEQHVLRSAEEEVSRKQDEIKAKMVEHEKKILERTKELQELSKAADTIKRSATTAVQNSEKVFNELIVSIQQKRIAMTNLIRAHEKADLGRLIAFFKQVSYEITILKEKYADLEHLLQTKDLTTLLETSKKICQPLGSESLPPVSINTNSLYLKTSVQKSVQKLKQSMESILQVEFAKMTVQPDSAIVSTEPLIRQDFLKYVSPIALDVNTAYCHLKLSDGNKQVAWTDESQHYPRLPQRFSFYNQVLGQECLPSPSYWEVEWTGEKGVYIAITHLSIKRQWCTTNIMLGSNDVSWSLECSPNQCCFRHNDKIRQIAVPSSNRVGVYVSAMGSEQTLSFYSVSDTMTLLHREEVRFQQIIYPALWIGVRSKAKLCSP